APRHEIELETERLGIGAAAVRHHSYLAGSLLILRPRAHDEGVVDRHAENVVDALGFELRVVREVARHVLRGAGRRERAGQTEQHDPLAAREVVDLEFVGPERTAFGLDLDVLAQATGGKPVANFDRHKFLLVTERGSDRRRAIDRPKIVTEIPWPAGARPRRAQGSREP